MPLFSDEYIKANCPEFQFTSIIDRGLNMPARVDEFVSNLKNNGEDSEKIQSAKQIAYQNINVFQVDKMLENIKNKQNELDKKNELVKQISFDLIDNIIRTSLKKTEDEDKVGYLKIKQQQLLDTRKQQLDQKLINKEKKLKNDNLSPKAFKNEQKIAHKVKLLDDIRNPWIKPMP